MDINFACEQFRILLQEQQARIANMTDESVDYSQKKTITVGIIDGDGIGPIIMAQTVRVLEKLLAEEIQSGAICLKRIEGLTIENRMALGESVPADVLAQIKSCDVLLKGPTTTPMGGTMESANVTLRRELDLYANVRPVTIPEEGIDWIFYRENTEGEYVLGSRGVDLPGMAVDFKVTTDCGTRRIAKAAFEYAKNNGSATIAMTASAHSSLALHADIILSTRVEEEGSILDIVPTASTTLQIALGDAIAAALIELRGFQATDFARLHPGGYIEKRLHTDN